MLDRFDIFIDIYSVNLEKLSDNVTGESSKDVKERIKQTMRFQAERYAETDGRFNSSISSSHIRQYINISD